MNVPPAIHDKRATEARREFTSEMPAPRIDIIDPLT